MMNHFMGRVAVIALCIGLIAGMAAAGQRDIGLIGRPRSIGFIGCSNTRDAVDGYHAVSGNLGLFWPTKGYHPQGMTVQHWANPSDAGWREFDRMKRTYGMPAAVWVQLCERVGDHQSNFAEVQRILANLKTHAPSVQIYISPLQPYDPPSLCPRMRNGTVIAELAAWADQAVAAGLALRGPGNRSDHLYPLGPLTQSLVYTDRCHPSGPNHGRVMAGSGQLLLGTQLVAFFDHLPR